ncbi:MAG: hypothetical protein U0798_01625 [Gemmataceae bacterium]
MSWIRRKLWMLVAAAACTAGTGCYPFAMGIFTPVPVQPWVAERMNEKYNSAAEDRTPILPPIQDGKPLPLCEDAPSDAEILRAMPRVARGVPYMYEQFRDDVTFAKNRIVDKIDPPRFYPLIGLAQLHHCHGEWVVYYTETKQSDGPFPTYVKTRRVEVIYIDKDHLHLYVGPNSDQQRQTLTEMTKY